MEEALKIGDWVAFRPGLTHGSRGTPGSIHAVGLLVGLPAEDPDTAYVDFQNNYLGWSTLRGELRKVAQPDHAPRLVIAHRIQRYRRIEYVPVSNPGFVCCCPEHSKKEGPNFKGCSMWWRDNDDGMVVFREECIDKWLTTKAAKQNWIAIYNTPNTFTDKLGTCEII
jgi:hypothetical protein